MRTGCLKVYGHMHDFDKKLWCVSLPIKNFRFAGTQRFFFFSPELFFFKRKSERGAYLQYRRAYVVYSANEALG